ncbi:MAG: phytase [Lachnospiraceae bacterium]|nr:phytase [Lachnospiraceae bacterium]
MGKWYKVIALIVLMSVTSLIFAACGKEDKNTDVKKDTETPSTVVSVTETVTLTPTDEPTPTTEATPTETPTPEPTKTVDNLTVKEYKHTSLQVQMMVPEAASITASDSALLAETDEYAIRLEKVNSHDGIYVLDEVDFFDVADSSEKKTALQEMLGLSALEFADSFSVVVKSDIDGVIYPVTKAEISEGDKKISGCGEFVVINAKDDVGVYTVVCIVKNESADALSERGEAIRAMLEKCAISLQQNYTGVKEFRVWKGKMSDGSEARFVYKNSVIKKIEEDDDGFTFYYNEDGTGYFLIQHSSGNGSNSAADYYIENLKNLFRDDGTEFSGTVDVNGKMKYRHVTMKYTEGGTEYKEEIFTSVDEQYGLWILDLYGTAADVEKQKENLDILLGSFEGFSSETQSE